ncbi:MAG: glycosyltransferase [Acidobacteria bacterium]|nr:glycosyltransferase [Acidobacteriota bacterium]
MATAPYFVISPNTILSLIGFLHGPDKTVATPAEDWRQAKVDVVIPALNEEENIVLCLASIAEQTMRPQRLVLIDDGSRDHTLDYARTFCEENGIELVAIQRSRPIGKTPTLKRQSRESDADVEFILDGDTVLESRNYIERTVQELYQAVGIASACGTVLPLRSKDRRKMIRFPEVRRFLEARPDASIRPKEGWIHRLDRAITNLYRGALYMFLQRFVYRGEMVFFGTISNPVGCAVAYRRKYVKELFDRYEPILGDDLTNSEDIFIGFAMLNEGYRNIQLTDVFARSREVEAHSLPRQIYMWSSSFLQSCFYFDDLLKSPFKSWRRHRHRKEVEAQGVAERRKVKEPYRQPFGQEYTRRYGRPVGWVLLMGAVEKISFPTVLVILMILGMWQGLWVTLVAETVVSLTVLTLVSKGHRVEYLFKGLLVTPLRYASLLYDLVTIGRFASDVWVRRERSWRK